MITSDTKGICLHLGKLIPAVSYKPFLNYHLEISGLRHKKGKNLLLGTLPSDSDRLIRSLGRLGSVEMLEVLGYHLGSLLSSLQ